MVGDIIFLIIILFVSRLSISYIVLGICLLLHILFVTFASISLEGYIFTSTILIVSSCYCIYSSNKVQKGWFVDVLPTTLVKLLEVLFLCGAIPYSVLDTLLINLLTTDMCVIQLFILTLCLRDAGFPLLKLDIEDKRNLLSIGIGGLYVIYILMVYLGEI